MKLAVDTEALLKAGVIDAATAGKIIDFYRRPPREIAEKSGMRLGAIIISVLAAGMTVLGAIVLLAHNWDNLPFALRVIVAFTPLAGGLLLGGYTIFRERGAALREISCVLIMGGVATALALVSQLYHLNGEYSEYMLTVLFLSLSFIYVFNSIAGTGLAAAGILSLLYSAPSSALTPLWALAPLIGWNLWKRPKTTGAVFWRIAVIVLCFVPLIRLLAEFTAISLMATIFTFSSFYICGIAAHSNGLSMPRLPGLFFGFLSMAIMLGIINYPDFDPYRSHHLSLGLLSSPHFWILIAVILICDARAFISARDPAMFALFCAPLAVLSGFSGVYTGILAAVLFISGMRGNSLARLNAGLIFAVILIFDWFIYDGSTVTRGIVFIAGGLLLAALNLAMARIFKRRTGNA